MTEGEIRKTVVVDAPPEVVFNALTDEKELVQWMPQEARMDLVLEENTNSSTTGPKKTCIQSPQERYLS